MPIFFYLEVLDCFNDRILKFHYCFYHFYLSNSHLNSYTFEFTLFFLSEVKVLQKELNDGPCEESKIL